MFKQHCSRRNQTVADIFLTERFYNDVGGRTTGLQTLSQQYCWLTRSTWYNTVAEWDAKSQTGGGQVR